MKKLFASILIVFLMAGLAFAVPPSPPSSGGTSIELTDSISTTSSEVAASATAVKAAYDHYPTVTDSISTTSSTTVASATAVKAAYDHFPTAGTIAAAGDATNFPAANVGEWYQVSSAGWLGGAAGVGTYTNVGDLWYCNTTAATGTLAQVGGSWNQYRHIISQPDGYRVVEMATDTAETYTPTNGYRWLNSVFTIYENSASRPVLQQQIDGHADITLSAAQAYNTTIYNTGQAAADVKVTLPTTAANMSVMGTVGTAQSNKWGVRAGASDKIYLLASDGTISAGSDNGYARMTAAQVGQCFACWTFKTDAYDWMCKSIAIGTSTFAAN